MVLDGLTKFLMITRAWVLVGQNHQSICTWLRRRISTLSTIKSPSETQKSETQNQRQKKNSYMSWASVSHFAFIHFKFPCVSWPALFLLPSELNSFSHFICSFFMCKTSVATNTSFIYCQDLYLVHGYPIKIFSWFFFYLIIFSPLLLHAEENFKV